MLSDIIIYTDGACSGNGRSNAKAGIGLYCKDQNIEISEEISITLSNLFPDLKVYKYTNNIAELLAIYRSIIYLEEYIKNGHKLYIKTDSIYSIKCLTTWYKKWEKNNWMTSNNKPVNNKNIIKSALYYMKKYKNIKICYTPAHLEEPDNKEEFNDWFGNMKADQLAKESFR